MRESVRMGEPELGRKPLPIQRILSENVGSGRVKSQSRLVMDLKSEGHDKENGEEQEQEQEQEEETAESDWCPEAAAMSSTMAVSTLSTPRKSYQKISRVKTERYEKRGNIRRYLTINS